MPFNNHDGRELKGLVERPQRLSGRRNTKADERHANVLNAAAPGHGPHASEQPGVPSDQSARRPSGVPAWDPTWPRG